MVERLEIDGGDNNGLITNLNGEQKHTLNIYSQVKMVAIWVYQDINGLPIKQLKYGAFQISAHVYKF